jgi:phosphatidylinositol alpha-1,6-mannosyltransferase
VRHLFVTNDFPPKRGGIESYLVSLCSGFDPAEVVVVAPSRKGYEPIDEALAYAVHRLPGQYLRARRPVERRVSEIAKADEADAVHFLQTLPLGRLARRVAKHTALPTTVVVHGSEVFVPSRAPLVRRVVRRVLTEADLVYCVSEYTRDAVDAFTKGGARLGLLPPSVSLDRFSLGVSGARVRERYRLGDRFVVLFVSRLVRRKGAEILVRAMQGMGRAIALIVGKGPEEASLRRLVEELELEGRVVFAGEASDEELAEYYAAADVFCMPCIGRLGGLDTEGFGIVYLEAAASGLPVVAGACGGSREAVVDGETGVVLDDVTPQALVDVLHELESDAVMRARLGSAGRARVETEFAPAVLAARLEAQLEQTITARAR